MAPSKKSRTKRRQAQARQKHHAQKARAREAEHHHLPSTGTRADDEYLLRRSREDLVDFGLTRVRAGWVNWVIAAVAVAAVVGLVLVLL